MAMNKPPVRDLLGQFKFTLDASTAKTLQQCDNAIGNGANAAFPPGAVRIRYIPTVDIRVLANGTAPTSTEGVLRKANIEYEFEGNLDDFRMIGTAAAVVWVEAYGERNGLYRNEG